MKKKLKILLLEDSSTDAEIIQRLLHKSHLPCEFSLAQNRAGFIASLKNFCPEIVLSDHSIPQFSSSEALEITRHYSAHTPFILVTGNVSEEFAIDIIKQGADDYILKDRMARLPAAIEAALTQRKVLKEIADYKYALDQSAIVAVTDPKGIILYANGNFSRISGYTAAELVGQKHAIVNSGYHPAAYMKNMWATIGRGYIWRGEFRNKAKDGTLYWVDTTIIPFLSADGKPYQYLAIRTDISERKKIEQELNKSNQRFKHAIQASSDIIWELNFEEKKYTVHQGSEKLKGLGEIINWDMTKNASYIYVEDRERVKTSFLQARMDPGRELWVDEYRICFTAEKNLYIVNHAIFIRDEKGRATRAVGAVTDITEKKKLEHELFEQQKKEQQKMTAMVIKAQEKERNIIGQELHDNVNQILAGTKLLLSTLLHKNETSKETLLTSMAYIQDAIEENRKIAHILVTPDFEINCLPEQLAHLTDKMLKPNGITVSLETASFCEDLLGQEQKLALYRTAQEQCTNIHRYAKAAAVSIQLSTADSLVKMTITDDGVGMANGKKTTGIGLRNIKGRISIFNGQVKVNSRPGKGFTLEITMPISTELQPAAGR